MSTSNRSPLSLEQTTVAWAFVTEHYAAISKRVWRLAGADRRLEADELLAESVLWIVRNHRSFDASLSPAEHWIYLLVRRARQDMLEKLNRQRDREIPLVSFGSREIGPIAESDSLALTDGGSEARATYARSRIAQTLRRAGPEVRACAQSALDEHSDAEARDFLGGSLAARRGRILRQLAS